MMSSYFSFRIISLIVMVVILIVVLVKKQSDKRGEQKVDAIKDVKKPEEKQNVTQANEHPEEEPKDKIDFEAIHKEMYYVEYKLIPQLVEHFKEQPNKTTQIVTTIYENLNTLQNRLSKIHPFAFGNVSCEVCGDIENESLVVYEYPRPLDMPLAKYGAIYFNIKQQEYKYLTLEFSSKGVYYLGSMTLGEHVNYGKRADLSKEVFIHEVCQIIKVDETIFQQRNKLSRKHMLELDDRGFKDAIANYPLLAVCFYDFNQPSQVLIPVLEQLAQEYRGRIAVGVFDVYGGSDHIDIPSEYSLRALPTILFFADGKLVSRHIGVCTREALKAKFDDLLEPDVRSAAIV